MNFEWLKGVDPVYGTILLTAAYTALLVWVFRRPQGPESGTWRDLRWWILLLVGIQITLHWVF